MINGYAPVIVFTYNRPQKTEECLNYLNKCDLAEECDMYVFVDGPKQDSHRDKVDQVKQIINKFAEKTNYKSIKISESAENKGLAKSVIAGVTQVINEYGCAIVVEDDLCVSSQFLRYMNSALSYYENEDKIWSISGYTEPLSSLKKEKKDVYLGYRACSWGWGTWKDRWNTVKWDLNEGELYNHKLLNKLRFMRGGMDLPKMLKRQLRGEIDSWAVRWCYAQSMQNRFCVFPTKTLLNNTGFDGSGTNCDDKGIVQELQLNNKRDFDFNEIVIDYRLTRSFFAFHEKQRICRFLSRIVKH